MGAVVEENPPLIPPFVREEDKRCIWFFEATFKRLEKRVSD